MRSSDAFPDIPEQWIRRVRDLLYLDHISLHPLFAKPGEVFTDRRWFSQGYYILDQRCNIRHFPLGASCNTLEYSSGKYFRLSRDVSR